MRYVLDSGIAADFIARRGLVPGRVRAARERGDRVGLCTPILAELGGGVLHSSNPEQNLAILRQRIAPLILWRSTKPPRTNTVGSTRRCVPTVGSCRCQTFRIAAIALTLGDCIVVSKDSDLREVPGLTVEDWSQP